MKEIPTVKIKRGADFAVMNKSDFDADKMELYDAPKKAKAKAKTKAEKEKV